MGMLNLSRLISKQRQRQRQRRRRQIRASNRWVASQAKRKGSPSQQNDNSLDSQIKGHSASNLPEDIWCFIHSLMPMRDAARVACVSRAFVRSWRCRPKLDFSQDTLLGLNKNGCRNDKKARYFNSRIDSILKKHSGIGLKALKFEVPSVYNQNPCHLSQMDSWLQNSVKPGIEELSISLDGSYNFPCSLLSGRTGDQLWYLSLACCHFHPTARLCLRSLTRLQLTMVNITSSELGSLLSSSFALKSLELRACENIICLKIPCLQQLSYLEVACCTSLKSVESKAPNLDSVWFIGVPPQVKLSFGETCHVKNLYRHCHNGAFYARTELPSSMPNLEDLTIRSEVEMVSTPMVPSKFLHLKFLTIAIGGLMFDYLSLVSFLDASPSLETFILMVMWEWKKRVSVFEDQSELRIMPGHHHSKLKHVKIIKFTAAKSVAELTCHILESATSLECLTLDTTDGTPRCSVHKTGKCISMPKGALVEAHEGLLAAEMFIKPKVSSTVVLNVVEPCSRCHRNKSSTVLQRHSRH